MGIINQYYLEPNYDSRNSFYKKALVKEYEDGTIVLQSYSTDVAVINKKSNEAVIRGFYSDTTTRHIKDFLYQYGYQVGSRQFLREEYTEAGKLEKEARLEKAKEREERKRLKEEELALKAQRKAERIEKRTNKIRISLTKELGDFLTKEQIESLVREELKAYAN